MTAYRFEGPGQKAIEHLLSVHPLCNAPDAALQAERWGDVTLVLVDDDWGWGSGEHALFAYIFPVLAALSDRVWDDDLARTSRRRCVSRLAAVSRGRTTSRSPAPACTASSTTASTSQARPRRRNGS
jgi:hypothetical protein